MRFLSRLGLAQRVVIAIALALGLVAVGSYVTTLGGPGPYFGWFGYAPLSVGIFRSPDLSPGEQFLVWLGLVVAWLGICLVMFRPAVPRERAGE